MNVGELRQVIVDVPDDVEVVFRRVAPVCGNVEVAGRAEMSTYGFFGTSVPCLILEPEEDDDAESTRPAICCTCHEHT